ncbi:MAG TPA: FAD-dependent oxidoreductase [Jiangellaceae bacterium]|nr:FAD-dependent oxidoreductase [Jiangellaceae bacterium]
MFEVVIVGGGYAGVTAANRLAATPGSPARVTVINPRSHFVERIRLHEYAAGTIESPNIDLSTLLHPAVNLVVDTVTRIDDERRVVILGSMEEMLYDYVIYAIGSGQGSAATDAYSVANDMSTSALRDRLQQLTASAKVEIIGGGLTGIETATEIAEQSPLLHVTLRTNGVVAPGFTESSRQRVRRGLRRLHVNLIEHSQDRTASTIPADEASDMVIWCAGFSVPSLAADSGLPVDEHGRLLVDAALRVQGFAHIFGAGDASVIDVPGYAYHRMSCASAMPMGGHAAANILDIISGREPTSHSSGYLAHCLSLGRGDGLIQFVRRNDTPVSFSLSGRPGAWVKELVSRRTIRWMLDEATKSGSYSWARGPA